MLFARRGRLAAVALLAVGLAIGPADATPVGAPAAGSAGTVVDPGPGSAGIGDAYFPKDGNGGYDVVHYDIHDRYGFDTGRLTGWTLVTARATEDLSRFNLDLVLNPTAVTVDGARAKFRHIGHELVVTPAKPVAKGARFAVRVDYRGRPGRVRHDGERPWFANRSEVIAIGEPHIAAWWFPANDHPRDKAAFDIHITVPRDKQVLANGERVGEPVVRGERATTHWRITEPISTYLAFFAAGRFRVEQGIRDGLPFTIAVSKRYSSDLEETGLRLLRRTPAIVAWLTRQFGPYPYSSTGGVMTWLDTGFALENASRPTYPFLGWGASARDVVVHELAHQWFGDAVSVHRWRDIWLNEGFASWVEWRYAEAHGGVPAQDRLLRRHRSTPARSSFWNLQIGRPGAQHLFAWPVYGRGAMTLQALRHRVGEADFNRLLRSWVRLHRGGTASGAQFERLAEQVSGKQLDGFFDAWLRTSGKPARTAANGLR
jgi:aminopeptidase N